MKGFRSKRLLAIVMAVLMVIGMMPTDWAATTASAATEFTGGEMVSGGTWDGWTWSVFGNTAGNNVSDNTIKEKDGKITLSATNNKGKIAGSNEGIDYFYRTVDASNDFILTADATLDVWTGSTNQAAWGAMVRSAVGTHKETADASPLSSIAVGGNVQTDAYAGWTRVSSIIRVSGDCGTQGSTYKLTIQKTGDVITTYKDNTVVSTASAADYISGSDLYVGLFVARTATVTYSNIHFDSVAGNGGTHTIDITDVTQPAKTTYIVGNTNADIDLTGFSAVVTIDGVTKTITGADCTVKTADFSSEATNDNTRLVLDYFGKEIPLTISVITEVVDSIDMAYAPVKNEYYIGDEIDFSGLDAAVNYNSGKKYSLSALIDAEKNGAALDGTTTVEVKDKTTGAVTQVSLNKTAVGYTPYTFDTAGDKTITFNHEKNGVTKSVSYDVTVSGATVTSLTVTGPNQTTFYKGVSADADAYKEGLLVTAEFSDGSRKVLSDGFTVVPVSSALDTSVAGNYEYQVSYGGKTVNYTLKVIGRTVEALEITTLPTKTNYVKGESFSDAGMVVSAVYDSGEKEVVSNPTVDSSAFNSSAAGEYTVKVSAAVDGKALNTSFTVSVREKTNYTYSDLTWKSVIFGQSVSKSKMSIDASNAGKVVIEAIEGAGKCTDDGQDGIAFYYTELDGTKDNFEITADITVDYFITKNSADNQEGFGIMVRDAIGTDGDSSIFYSNAMSVGGYYGTWNVFGREGVNSQDDTLGKSNKVLNGKGTSSKVTKDAPRTFTLTLKKDNSGITGKMVDKSTGNTVAEKFFYMSADAFTKQSDTMYVGFMAARGAKIEVDTSTVSMNITAQSADAPQEFAPETPVTPSVSQGSLSTTADENYTYIVNVNTKGLLSLKQNGKTIVSQKDVTAGSYEFETKLIEGENKFQVYFEPDATQNITSSASVVYNTTVTRKIYGPTKQPIYASASGNASAAGTSAEPLDIQTAIDYCQIGQAVYLAPGTYNLKKTTGVWKYNNGTGETGRKYLMKDPSASGDVVIDFGGDYSAGKFVSNTFDISGDYWTVDSIKFANGGGVRVGGNNNIIKNCEFYGHSNSGLSISRTDSAADKADWPSNNQVISCYSYENRDKSDNNADGFAAKLTCGEGNVFRYCVAAYNADDGWDLFSKGGTGAIGAVEIYDSVCFANGYTLASGELVPTKGDGNGFKMGGSGIAVNHKVFNSYSFGNRANGFTNNSDPMGVYSNCVGYNNGGSNLELHVYTGVTPQFKVTGFKSFSDDTISQIPDLDYTDKEAKIDVISLYYSTSNFFRDKAGAEGKSVNAEGKEITAANFANLDKFVSIMKGGIPTISRNSDGSVNMGGFLKYTATKEDTGNNGSGGAGDEGNAGDEDDDYYDWEDDDFEDESTGGVTVGTTVSGNTGSGTGSASGSVSSVTVDDSLKDLVGFTQAELNKITNGASASVILQVKDISVTVSEAQKKVIEEAAAAIRGSYKVGAYLDLSVIKSIGEESSKISNLTAPVKITVTVPDSLINKNAAMHREYKIIRIHGDEVDTIDAAFDASNNQLSFYTDRFSTYAIVYSDAYASAPMTGDTANASMYVMMLMLAVLLMGYSGYGIRKYAKVNR